MKTRYKIIIIFLIVLIMGNFMYLFDWSRDMLKGYQIGCIVGIISGFLGAWLIKE